jgi:hypothetical protein
VGRRGVSELYASRDWFKVFKSFMEGRAAINEAAQSISYKRKIKGSPAAVARFQNKLGSLTTGYEQDGSEGLSASSRDRLRRLSTIATRLPTSSG